MLLTHLRAQAPLGPEAADVPTEDSSASSSSDSESEWTANEGVTSDEDEETPAAPKLRGQAALVTAACPRRYLRLAAERKERGVFIPEDFSTEEFLRSFRRVWDANTTVALEKATCHDEPHKRWRRSMDRREHKHIALLAGATFAHKKIADAFQCKIWAKTFLQLQTPSLRRVPPVLDGARQETVLGLRRRSGKVPDHFGLV